MVFLNNCSLLLRNSNIFCVLNTNVDGLQKIIFALTSIEEVEH